MIALVTGGSGCGKSTWAEGFMRRFPGPRYYIATMQAVDGECVQRIARHRAQRAGLGFETLETARDVGSAAVSPGAAALVECLPTLMAGEMFGGDPDRVLPGVEKLMEVCGDLVVVTNDVFSDGLTYDPDTAAYMQRLSEVNRAVAARADLVVEVVYGIPLIVKGAIP